MKFPIRIYSHSHEALCFMIKIRYDQVRGTLKHVREGLKSERYISQRIRTNVN
jgi:hypothetical protein